MYNRSLSSLKLITLPLVLVVFGLPSEALSAQLSGSNQKGIQVEIFNSNDGDREGFPGDRVGGGTRNHETPTYGIFAHSS